MAPRVLVVRLGALNRAGRVTAPLALEVLGLAVGELHGLHDLLVLGPALVLGPTLALVLFLFTNSQLQLGSYSIFIQT